MGHGRCGRTLIVSTAVFLLVGLVCQVSAQECKEDEVHLLQRVQTSPDGSMSPVEKNRRKPTVERGRPKVKYVLELSHLSVPDADRCHVQGTLKAGDREYATFRVNESLLELSVPELPAFIQEIDRKTNTSRVTIGSAVAGEPQIEAYFLAANALGQSKFAKYGARKLSDHLFFAGFDGATAPCAFSLHMLLKKLSAAARAPPVSLLSVNASKWGTYGYDSTCPGARDRTWRCRIEQGVRRRHGTNGAWYTADKWYAFGFTRRRRENSRRRRLFQARRRYDSNDPLSPVNPGTTVCEDTYYRHRRRRGDAGKRRRSPESTRCVGLCGAASENQCDCWQGICGDKYRCGYNPYCCAHDMACIDGGWMSQKCLNAATVTWACQNNAS